MKTIPNNWVIVKITTEANIFYKVFASWIGDEWRINSGISSIYYEDGNYRIPGYSGSHYVCKENKYGFATSYSENVLNNIIEKAKEENTKIEILPKDTNFLEII